MSRSTEEILAHAEELDRRFDDYAPANGNAVDAQSLRAIRHAFLHRAQVEHETGDAVTVVRAESRS